jgi:hypothetical protein
VAPSVFFVGTCQDSVTHPSEVIVIENALRLRVALPSLTLITMFP